MYITGHSQSVNESIITVLEQGDCVNEGLIICEIIVLSWAPIEEARGWNLWVRINRDLYEKKEVKFYQIGEYSAIKRDQLKMEMTSALTLKISYYGRA